ncbi:hypothetical protein [Haloferax elongans]|uniref:hypothetical protein n=1 Tax=Haloferax elongans TaxID=403191 RepID=UPI000ABBF57B|nr:hypothetical protein [Haloferax elongans]
MTDHEDLAPELPADESVLARRYCGECDRHVVSDHDHAHHCSQWRGSQEADDA